MTTTKTETAPVALVHVVAPELVLGTPAPKPQSPTGQLEASTAVWTTPDGRTETGVWECDPGTFPSARNGTSEICQITSGRATITGDDGVVAEIGPGSTLVLPDGWSGTWKIHETVRKLYVTIQHED